MTDKQILDLYERELSEFVELPIRVAIQESIPQNGPPEVNIEKDSSDSMTVPDERA